MSARLAYAIAFEAVRDILLLDEIFAVGDASFTEKCAVRYRELHAAGHTILLVSHDPGLIKQFCDRAILLDDGMVVLDDTAEKVAEAYEGRLRPRGKIVAL
jgi:ABC-type polysaccharide/polyol phosphate transport system ATPase subunit